MREVSLIESFDSDAIRLVGLALAGKTPGVAPQDSEWPLGFASNSRLAQVVAGIRAEPEVFNSARKVSNKKTARGRFFFVL